MTQEIKHQPCAWSTHFEQLVNSVRLCASKTAGVRAGAYFRAPERPASPLIPQGLVATIHGRS
jgi:hypothetical protein